MVSIRYEVCSLAELFDLNYALIFVLVHAFNGALHIFQPLISNYWINHPFEFSHAILKSEYTELVSGIPDEGPLLEMSNLFVSLR